MDDRKKNSTCADCKQKGHWKGDPECPKVQSGETKPFKKKEKDALVCGTVTEEAEFTPFGACSARSAEPSRDGEVRPRVFDAMVVEKRGNPTRPPTPPTPSAAGTRQRGKGLPHGNNTRV